MELNVLQINYQKRKENVFFLLINMNFSGRCVPVIENVEPDV